ncbi:hypothetical protein H8R17_09925 [Streptomyces sp. TRM68367]|nr:hypothetical protein [Streptomyces sp. TRM68367]
MTFQLIWLTDFTQGAVRFYVFWAGQFVAAMELCAAIPASATTAAPATVHVRYLGLFDCRYPAIPTPESMRSYVTAYGAERRTTAG